MSKPETNALPDLPKPHGWVRNGYARWEEPEVDQIELYEPIFSAHQMVEYGVAASRSGNALATPDAGATPKLLRTAWMVDDELFTSHSSATSWAHENDSNVRDVLVYAHPTERPSPAPES